MGFIDFVTDMNWLYSIVLAVGLILVVVEMFHPGFGAPGIAGIILLVLGIILTANSPMQALFLIIIILVILGIALSLVLKSATKGRLSKILILSDAQKKEEGYIGTEDLEYFLGKEGIALTVLRPSGIGDFDGVKLDVVSESEFITKDSKIKIVKVEGRRIVVRELK